MEQLYKANTKARFQLRGDTDGRFLEEDPILASREPVLVLDAFGAAVGVKIGDGLRRYAELPLHPLELDMAALAEAVISRLPNGDEVSY